VINPDDKTSTLVNSVAFIETLIMTRGYPTGIMNDPSVFGRSLFAPISSSVGKMSMAFWGI